MVSETMLRLEAKRISLRYWESGKKTKPWVNIDMQKQISIENIGVWEIDNGTNKMYRISIPGLSQNNYNDRIMIRGKQPERHVLGQYAKKNATMNMYPITNYLSDEEQIMYLQLLGTNNIRGCIEYLRKKETTLNLEPIKDIKGPIKVRVRLVKKGN